VKGRRKRRGWERREREKKEMKIRSNPILSANLQN
jgi:hypothetical protein